MLHAALLPGELGREAARQWLASVNFETLGKATRAILPILYERLREDGLSTPLMPLLKGVKRHTWYNNRRLFHHGGTAVRLLKEAGIEVMVIKGASMAVHYYHDESLRPMEDLDILVNYQQGRSAVSILTAHGWSISPVYCMAGLSDQFIDEDFYVIGKAIHLVHVTGVHLDLHWNLTKYSLGEHADDDFWAGANECAFEGQLVKVLNPADQLFHILVHGAPWSTISPIRWVSDAVTVLRLSPDFDWDRLIQQAQKRSLTLMVRNTLGHLDAYFPDMVAPHVLVRLQDQTPKLFEHIEYWSVTRSGSNGLFRSVVRILSDYLRYSKDRSLFYKALLMPSYLRVRFRAKGFCEFVSIALKKIGKHVARNTS